MLPKSKRARQSSAAAGQGREALKKARSDLEIESSETVSHTTASTSVAAGDMHAEAAPMSAASSSSTTEPVADPKKTLQDFAEKWVQSLDQEDKKCLAMPFCSTLVNEFSFTETRAAEFAAKIVNKSDRTVRQWRTDLISNNGTFPESKQGRYQRSGVMCANEELCEKAMEYVRANSAVQGTQDVTTMDFCKWVNKMLLGFPCKVSVETA